MPHPHHDPHPGEHTIIVRCMYNPDVSGLVFTSIHLQQRILGRRQDLNDLRNRLERADAPRLLYFAVFNMRTFLGDTISRKVASCFPPAPALSYVLIIIVGAVLSLLRMPILRWPGLFFATATKHMDNTFKKGTELAQYHLIALSVVSMGSNKCAE